MMAMTLVVIGVISYLGLGLNLMPRVLMKMKPEDSMKNVLILFTLFQFVSTISFSAIKTRVVEYKEGTTTLEGFLAYDDVSNSKRPGILIVHEWTGLGDYVKTRARKLAGMGYVAFCVDIYGKGIRAKDASEAGQLAVAAGDAVARDQDRQRIGAAGLADAARRGAERGG